MFQHFQHTAMNGCPKYDQQYIFDMKKVLNIKCYYYSNNIERRGLIRTKVETNTRVNGQFDIIRIKVETNTRMSGQFNIKVCMNTCILLFLAEKHDGGKKNY